MVKRKVAELEGAALDWAVATSEGRAVSLTPFFASLASGGQSSGLCVFEYETKRPYRPSIIWGQGGPLIENHCIMTYPSVDYESNRVGHWTGVKEGLGHSLGWVGGTPLEAAMRAIVASELGEEVEIPEELA